MPIQSKNAKKTVCYKAIGSLIKHGIKNSEAYDAMKSMYAIFTGDAAQNVEGIITSDEAEEFIRLYSNTQTIRGLLFNNHSLSQEERNALSDVLDHLSNQLNGYEPDAD